MKYKGCYWISSGIHFDKNEIRFLKHKVTAVAFSIEDLYYKKNYPDFPSNIIDLIEYFIYNANKYGIDIEPTCEIKSILSSKGNS